MDTAQGLRPIGRLGRLGRYVATPGRGVFFAWALIAVGLGLLAPRVETALSGAGWEAGGSESVQVRGKRQREVWGGRGGAGPAAGGARAAPPPPPPGARPPPPGGGGGAGDSSAPWPRSNGCW